MDTWANAVDRGRMGDSTVAPHPQLARAWETTQLRWDERRAHEQLLAVAFKHDGCAWLATQYGHSARGGDVIARGRLPVVRRVAELRLLAQPSDNALARPYGRCVRLFAALMVVLGLGLALARMMHDTTGALRGNPRTSQRGSAMLVVMVLIAALLAGAAALTSMQTGSLRGADLATTTKRAHACAESGLVASRSVIANHWSDWNSALASGTQPAWLTGINADLDGDGAADFAVTLRDNEDELAGTDDPTRDNDLTVFIVSTCTKYPDTPVQLTELVNYNGGGNCYESQLGGCGGNNNAN